MIVIPINEDTQQLIAALNNGVQPVIEDEHTSFVYKGANEVPEIMPTSYIQLYVLGMKAVEAVDIPLLYLYTD
jgi:hypothetical protein